MYVQYPSKNQLLYTYVSETILQIYLVLRMLNKNKKFFQGQSEATCKQAGATKSFDIS